MKMNGLLSRILAFILFLGLVFVVAAQEGTRLAMSVEFVKVPGIAATYCAGCHGWAATPEGLATHVAPGNPADSTFLTTMESGEMPPSDPKPTEAEKALVRDWIMAGAIFPETAPGMTGDGTGSGKNAVQPIGTDKIGMHKVLGFTSSGLLLAAGAIGAWRFLDMMYGGHEYRDLIHFPEEGGIESVRSAEIASLWADPAHAALRWAHIGLLAAGSTLYIINAVTGTSMFSPEDPGLSKRDLHRYGFFLHVGLMTASAVLGFMTSDALMRGDHELVSELGPVHMVFGAVTPLVIAASGFIFTIEF